MAEANFERKVPYVHLGNSGLKISKVILGCMSYGSPDWQKWVLGEAEGIEQIKYAYEHGIQTFDTANIYSNGESESILGKAIKHLKLPRDEIVVMTKVHGVVGKTHSEIYRDRLFVADQKGLERLQLDYIDLLQCHRFDKKTLIEETMQALHDVVKAGYVRYIGMSSCWAWQFAVMQNYAINNGLTPFISMQNHYSLIYREEEREMMPTLKHFGEGSLPWSPLARGMLTRPLGATTTRSEVEMYRPILSHLTRECQAPVSWHDAYLKAPSNQEVVRRVEEVAKKHSAKMAQVALAWCMAKDPVSAPVVGTTSLDKPKELIDAFEVKLTDEEIKYLEEPYEPMNIMGHI